MKWMLLLLLFVSAGWACAADSDSQNAFVKLTEEESIDFARAICDSKIAQEDSCKYHQDPNNNRLLLNFSLGEFLVNSVIYGNFTSPHSKEAFVDLIITETEFSRSSAFFRYHENKWHLIDFNRDNGAYYCSKSQDTKFQDFLVCGSIWFDFGFDFGTNDDDASIYAEFNSFYDLETFRFENDIITPKYLLSIVNPSLSTRQFEG